MAIYTKKILQFSVRNYRNQLRKCAKNSNNADAINAAKNAYLAQKGAQKEFNDIQAVISGISPNVRELVSKYPKGSFKRVNKPFLDTQTNKRYTIVYEGVKVNFDLTAEGLAIQKQRKALSRF